MKITELQLNDWVRVTDDDTKEAFIGCITAIDLELENVSVKRKGEETAYPFSIDCIEEISLSPEILEKNGFKKDINGDFELVEEEYGVRVVRRSDVYAFTLVTTRGGITDMFRFTLHRVGPFSVHWLQHALKLCGIKKEIAL